MSESSGVISRIDEADTEVELSAQELLALADSRQIDERDTRPTLQPSRPATSASSRKLVDPKTLINRYVGASRLTHALIITAGIVGAAYVLNNSGRVNPSTTISSQLTAQSEWPAPEQIAEGEPVRFANPFDTDEVFEFPPGTTETEAREAVAAVLMERAMSREKS